MKAKTIIALCLLLLVFSNQVIQINAVSWGTKVGKHGGGGSWTTRVTNTQTNNGGNQGISVQIGKDSRTSNTPGKGK